MAAAFVVMVLCLRDGYLCLKGRLAETTLQLPHALRLRINAVIRRGAKQRHFVAAAAVTGVVISVLEMACTGQVYLPTILYVLESGAQKGTAVAYLVWYNVAFVAPLLAVMALAYTGLTHEALNRFFQKHVAAVKFATAGVFALMLAFFVWDALRGTVAG